MLLFVHWPKIKIEKKQDPFCSFSIIISYLRGKLVLCTSRLSEEHLWLRQQNVDKRCVLMVVDPPEFGSRQSVGDENGYFDVRYQTAISNSRCDGNLTNYGRGSGRGSENTILPPAWFYPSWRYVSNTWKVKLYYKHDKEFAKIDIFREDLTKKSYVIAMICTFYVIAYMGLYLKKCREKRGWIWKKMCVLSLIALYTYVPNCLS